MKAGSAGGRWMRPGPFLRCLEAEEMEESLPVSFHPSPVSGHPQGAHSTGSVHPYESRVGVKVIVTNKMDFGEEDPDVS